MTLSAVLLVLLTACSIHQTKTEDHGDKKVEIKTPFASMEVSTDMTAKDAGLTAYPGARAKEKSDHDKGRVNLSMGGESFGLKVVAATYLSDDPPQKVIEFYRNDLKRYGKVLECPKGISENHDKDESTIRCDDKGHAEDGKLDLAVGVPQHQHLVSVKPNGSGTEFALVYIDIKGKDRETM